jgi:hypothetical protein
VPCLGRTIKKSPESASTLTCIILENTAADVKGLIVEALQQTCVRILKSSSHEVRANAGRVVRVCAMRCSDAATLSNLLTSFLDACLGKVAGSSLVLPYQRASVMLSLREVATVLKSRDVSYTSAIVSVVLPSLLLAATRETEVNSRMLAMRTAGHWASLVSIGRETIEFFNSGLGKPRDHLTG